MIKQASTISTSLYKSVAKPIMFKFSADSMHSFATKMGIIAQKTPFLLQLVSKFWRYDSSLLEQTLAGIRFSNPMGLSAGFDKEARLPKLMHAIGFGVIEVGSITARPYEGNKKPWYSRLIHTQSILVNSGLRSSGLAKIADTADRNLDSKIAEAIVINASVARTNFQDKRTVQESIDDYCISLRRLEKSKWHKMYTINISCPNTAGGEPFNEPENLQKLLQAIDDLRLTRPVFLKLPIDLGWERADQLILIAKNSSLQGLVIGNLSKDRSQVDPSDTLTSSMRGNLSGKPCWDASNELLARTKYKYGDRFILVGVGGIFTGEDVYTKIRLGANFVELITGMIFNGPASIGSINADLVKLLEKDGFSSISEAVGVDARDYVDSLP